MRQHIKIRKYIFVSKIYEVIVNKIDNNKIKELYKKQ